MKTTAFRDLPADAYPFKIEFYDLAGTVVHVIEVPGPGVTEIPGLAKDHGPVGVRITLATGEVLVEEPPPAPPGETRSSPPPPR